MSKRDSSRHSGQRERSCSTKQRAANCQKPWRPTDYRSEYCEAAYRQCLLGARDIDLADLFGVAESTIHLWKKKHADFSESIKRGKRIADMNVAHALYQRALGVTWIEERPFKLKRYEVIDGRSVCVEEYIQMVSIQRTALADVQACKFWLKNRCPEHWKDKVIIEAPDLGLAERLMAARERVRQERSQITYGQTLDNDV